MRDGKSASYSLGGLLRGGVRAGLNQTRGAPPDAPQVQQAAAEQFQTPSHKRLAMIETTFLNVLQRARIFTSNGIER
jgi:ribosomal protein S10